MSEDPEIESFLRRFRPIPPGPLARRADLPIGRWLLIAAAVVLAVAGTMVGRLTERRGTADVDRPGGATVGALSAALRDGRHEAALAELEAHVLPDPGWPGGALTVLADVRRDR